MMVAEIALHRLRRELSFSRPTMASEKGFTEHAWFAQPRSPPRSLESDPSIPWRDPRILAGLELVMIALA